MEKLLFLSDDFIFNTLEGEGRFVGYPSVFLRLSMCNLSCSAFKSNDSPHGCDSFISWRVKNKFTFDELNSLFESTGNLERLKKGHILKISGGEPLLQQNNLLLWVNQFKRRYGFSQTYMDNLPNLIIDFETNGTIMPEAEWSAIHNATFTTSPKMSNNGDPVEKRYKPKVLQYLVTAGACFKFVINSPEDLKELYDNYINGKDVKVPKNLIWLMPCCGSRKEHEEKATWVAELCKEHDVKFSPRLHLVLWNKALLV